MLEALIDIDKKLLLVINSWHTPWLDDLMMALTNGLYWLPLFVFVIAAIIFKYRRNAILIFAYMIVVIILTDQVSSSILKPLIGRLRPSHDPTLKDLVHLVNNYRGGMYSFVSSHAANAFGVATFLFLAAQRKLPWIWLMFGWATIFAYTRLYLGVHYPLDIICGALLGALLAWMVIWISKRLPEKIRLKT